MGRVEAEEWLGLICMFERHSCVRNGLCIVEAQEQKQGVIALTTDGGCWGFGLKRSRGFPGEKCRADV